MIADMKANKKLSPIITELFIKRHKTQYFTGVLYHNLISKRLKKKDYYFIIILIVTRYFLMKIPNKREFQQVVSNHPPEIQFKDIMKLYKDYIKRPFSFLAKDTALPFNSSIY